VLPVRYELNLYIICRRKYTAFVAWWSKSLASLATERRCTVLSVRYELNLYMLCRRKFFFFFYFPNLFENCIQHEIQSANFVTVSEGGERSAQ
jgi:hypothetical protein